MLPSNSSHPFSYSDQAFDFESNPTSNQETINCDDFPDSPPNLSFFHFPNSPFVDYQFSHDILLEYSQHQTDHLLLAEPEPQPIVNNTEEITGVSSIEKITKVTRKKRDRHSKINTARGLRDRRMRLSLQVAKRFFGLQEMLGFEKASKTVEWLLNQAKEEINHVAAAAAAKSSVSSSPTFECEGLSSPEEVVRKPPGVKRRTKHCSRKFIARECREKARERARERTKEKMRRSKQCELDATNHKLSKLGSCKSLNPSLDLVTNARELSSTSLSEKHLGTVEATVHDDRFFGYCYEQKEHHHVLHEFSE